MKKIGLVIANMVELVSMMIAAICMGILLDSWWQYYSFKKSMSGNYTLMEYFSTYSQLHQYENYANMWLDRLMIPLIVALVVIVATTIFKSFVEDNTK